MTIRTDDFQFLSHMLRQNSGLVINEDKVYLLESRLLPVARKFNMNSLDDICNKLRNQGDPKLTEAVVEAMTTNESSFFRDSRPFDQFKQYVLPELLKTNAARKQIRIWSAAASSGQEAYSLAMVIKEESAKLAGWQIEIIGTDLSKEMVEKAQAGIYSQFEVQRGLPIQYLMKYFTQQIDRWQINEDMRKMVQYRVGNLLHDFGSMGMFDVILCRNVLIYFDQPNKTKVLNAMARQLNPHGFLYLGGAETVLGICDRFKPAENQRGIYLLNQETASAAKAS